MFASKHDARERPHMLWFIYRNSDVAHYLINYGADVNVQTRNGCTAFDIASMSGNPQIFRQ